MLINGRNFYPILAGALAAGFSAVMLYPDENHKLCHKHLAYAIDTLVSSFRNPFLSAVLGNGEVHTPITTNICIPTLPARVGKASQELIDRYLQGNTKKDDLEHLAAPLSTKAASPPKTKASVRDFLDDEAAVDEDDQESSEEHPDSSDSDSSGTDESEESSSVKYKGRSKHEDAKRRKHTKKEKEKEKENRKKKDKKKHNKTPERKKPRAEPEKSKGSSNPDAQRE